MLNTRADEPQSTAIARYAGITDEAMEFIRSAKSAATLTAYKSDFADFERYCNEQAIGSLPATPDTVANYVAHLAQAGRKVATIRRRVVSISKAHQLAELESPTSHATVRETLKGIANRLGTAQSGKAAIVTDDLRKLVAKLGPSTIDVRDRAMLLVAFAGAFRRSELVALDVEDVRDCRNGIELTIRRSKTDQEGAGALVAIPYGSRSETCPVRALRDWLSVAAITEGAIFRAILKSGEVTDTRLGSHAVARTVQRRATEANLDGDLAGHSLRSGFVTSAHAAGVSLHDIMRQTRHKSESVARKYIRSSTVWERNAAERVGL